MAFPTGWTKRHKLTIDATKVPGTNNLTNIPILFTEDNFLQDAFDNSDNGGGDLRFSSDDAGATQLACEVVVWDNGATNTAEVWVKIPTLDYDDNTVIYVWYGKTGENQPAANAAYGSQAVWSANFQGVWHFQNNYNDSSANGYNLSDGNAPDYTATGGLAGGGAYDYEKDNSDYLTIANASCPNLETTGDHTYLCWFKPESKDITNGFFYIMGKTNAGVTSYRSICANVKSGDPNRDHFYVTSIGAGPGYEYNFNVSITTGTWYHLGLVYNQTEQKLKCIVNSNVDDVAATGTPSSVGSEFTIGRGGAYTGHYSDGIIDEAWVITAGMSNDWITTVYNNQNAPATFSTGSDATSVGSTSTIKKLAGLTQATVKKVTGVAIASVKKVIGVSN